MRKYILWLNTERALAAYEDNKNRRLPRKDRVVAKILEGRAYDERELSKEGVFPFGIELSFNRHLEKLLKDNIHAGYKKSGCVEGYDYDLVEVKQR